MRALLFWSLAFLVVACGNEPRNPYEASDERPTAVITAAYFQLQHKVVDDTLNSALIIGTHPAIDVDLWLYDAADTVVAKFPMRWRFTTTGFNIYTWMHNGGVIGVKGFSGKTASSLLGSYSGAETGIGAIGGQTSFRGTNDADVAMRVVTTVTGMGVALSLTRVTVQKGITEQTHAWDSTIVYEQEPTNW